MKLPTWRFIRTAEAFPVVEKLPIPTVKICFDIYHLQLSEGNITNNLKQGPKKTGSALFKSANRPAVKNLGLAKPTMGSFSGLCARPATKGTSTPSTVRPRLRNTRSSS